MNSYSSFGLKRFVLLLLLSSVVIFRKDIQIALEILVNHADKFESIKRRNEVRVAKEEAEIQRELSILRVNYRIEKEQSETFNASELSRENFALQEELRKLRKQDKITTPTLKSDKRGGQ